MGYGPFDDSVAASRLAENSQQHGMGIFSSIKEAFSGDYATRAKNLVQPNPQYRGEAHVPQYRESDGKLVLASYMGPGTNLPRRIVNLSKPVSKSDKTAQAHDLRYALSGPNPSKITSADDKMIAKLKQLKESKEDSAFNVNVGLYPLQAKKLGERTGLVSELEFAPKNNLTDARLIAKYEKKLRQLEQEGFGTPAYNLKKQVLSNLNKLSPSLKKVSSLKKRVMKGKGVMLAGQSGKGLVLAGSKSQRGGTEWEDFKDAFTDAREYGGELVRDPSKILEIKDRYNKLLEKKKNRNIRDRMQLQLVNRATRQLLGKREPSVISQKFLDQYTKSKGLAQGSLDPDTLEEQRQKLEKFREQKGVGYSKKHKEDSARVQKEKMKMKKFMAYVRSKKK